MKVRKIVFIHNLNNFSGSPKVLLTIIKSLSAKYDIDLISSNGNGFLSDIEGVNYINNYYKWSDNKKITSFRFFISQIIVFFKVLLYKKSNTLFYINTIMPASAALACRIGRKNMIYHVHENMHRGSLLYSFLKLFYQLCNTKTIFVSKYLQQQTQGVKSSCVIYNCLDKDFIESRDNYFSSDCSAAAESILFVSSLKSFKGVDEFVVLAQKLPEYRFEMVLSATVEEINQYFASVCIPLNLKIFPLQKNLHSFYQRARILLQLSHPNKWVETFGLTILEAMSYAVPCIVPNVGGPLELVDNGINGYVVNPLDIDTVILQINSLMSNDAKHKKFSEESLLKSAQFDLNLMTKQIEQYIL